MIAQRSARVESELLIRNYSCYVGLFMHRFYDEGMTLDADVHIDAGKRSSLPEENVTVVIGLTSPKRLKEKIKPKEISPKSNWQVRKKKIINVSFLTMFINLAATAAKVRPTLLESHDDERFCCSRNRQSFS